MPRPPGTQPMEPSPSTGAARTTEPGSRPGWGTIGRAWCVCRSQFAVLLASQIPLKSGFPATRAKESVTAAETDGALGAKSVKRPAVTAAADTAMAQLLPKNRIGRYLVPHLVYPAIGLGEITSGQSRILMFWTSRWSQK